MSSSKNFKRKKSSDYIILNKRSRFGVSTLLHAMLQITCPSSISLDQIPCISCVLLIKNFSNVQQNTIRSFTQKINYKITTLFTRIKSVKKSVLFVGRIILARFSFPSVLTSYMFISNLNLVKGDTVRKINF